MCFILQCKLYLVDFYTVNEALLFQMPANFLFYFIYLNFNFLPCHSFFISQEHIFAQCECCIFNWDRISGQKYKPLYKFYKQNLCLSTTHLWYRKVKQHHPYQDLKNIYLCPFCMFRFSVLNYIFIFN